MSVFGKVDYSKLSKNELFNYLQREITSITESENTINSATGVSLKFLIETDSLEKRSHELNAARRKLAFSKKRLARIQKQLDKKGFDYRSAIQNAHHKALLTRESLEDANTVATSTKRLKFLADELLKPFADKKLTSNTNRDMKDFADRFQTNFAFFGFIFDAMDGAFAIFRIINGLFLNRDNKAASAIQIFIGIISLVLAVISTLAAVSVIVIATPILILAGAIKGVINNALKIMVDVYERFFSDKAKEREEKIDSLMKNCNTLGDLSELTAKINERNEANRTIADRTHGLIQGLVAVVGAVFLFIPPLTVAGVVILAALATYSLLDTFNLNPLRWAARGVNALYKKIAGKPMAVNPFDTLSENEVRLKYKGRLDYTAVPKRESVKIEIAPQEAAVQSTSFSEGTIIKKLALRQKVDPVQVAHETVNFERNLSDSSSTVSLSSSSQDSTPTSSAPPSPIASSREDDDGESPPHEKPH